MELTDESIVWITLKKRRLKVRRFGFLIYEHTCRFSFWFLCVCGGSRCVRSLRGHWQCELAGVLNDGQLLLLSCCYKTRRVAKFTRDRPRVTAPLWLVERLRVQVSRVIGIIIRETTAITIIKIVSLQLLNRITYIRIHNNKIHVGYQLTQFSLWSNVGGR